MASSALMPESLSTESSDAEEDQSKLVKATNSSGECVSVDWSASMRCD